VECTTQGCQGPDCAGGGDGWIPPGQVFPTVVVNNSIQSCSVNCPDGLPFTYALPAGKISGINQDYVDQQAKSLACNVAQQELMCLNSIPSGCLNQPYAQVIQPTGGMPPYFWAIVEGGLPPGLVSMVGEDVLIISGTPTQAGNFPFTVLVTDSNGLFMQKTFQIGIMKINSPTSSTLNMPYSFSYTVTGGTPPYTFSIASGSLPSGLSLSKFGTISGVPSSMGTSNFRVSVTDSSP
jgi:hypothetical protein